LTATFDAPRGVPTTSFAPAGRGPGSGLDEELRGLLRSRLILVHLLALAFIILLATLSFLMPGQEEDSSLRPDQGQPWRLAPLLVECLLGAAILWRSPRMSMRSLRLWELIFFATHTAYNGLLRFEVLAHVAEGAPNPPSLAVGFRGVVSLTGFVTLILAYGVLIPNTPRTSLLAVAALTALPFP